MLINLVCPMQAIGCLKEDSILLSVLHSFLAKMKAFSGVNSAIGIYLFTYINCLCWYEIQEQTISYFKTCSFQRRHPWSSVPNWERFLNCWCVAPLFFLKRMAY